MWGYPVLFLQMVVVFQVVLRPELGPELRDLQA